MIKTYTYSVNTKNRNMPKYKADWLGNAKDLPMKTYPLQYFGTVTTPVRFTNLETKEFKNVQVRLLDCCSFYEKANLMYTLRKVDMEYWLTNMILRKEAKTK